MSSYDAAGTRKQIKMIVITMIQNLQTQGILTANQATSAINAVNAA